LRARGTAICVLVVVAGAHFACRIFILNDASVPDLTQAVAAINRTGARVRERRTCRARCAAVGVLVVISWAHCARGRFVLNDAKITDLAKTVGHVSGFLGHRIIRTITTCAQDSGVLATGTSCAVLAGLSLIAQIADAVSDGVTRQRRGRVFWTMQARG
jgi:hypothetical protein